MSSEGFLTINGVRTPVPDDYFLEVNGVDTHIPKHWFDKNEQKAFWHLPSGIYSDWKSKQQHSKRIYAWFILLSLREIPKANEEIEKCHIEFQEKFGDDILAQATAQIQNITKTEDLKLAREHLETYFPEKDSPKIEKIFKSWVKKWALGSSVIVQLKVLVLQCQDLIAKR